MAEMWNFGNTFFGKRGEAEWEQDKGLKREAH